MPSFKLPVVKLFTSTILAVNLIQRGEKGSVYSQSTKKLNLYASYFSKIRLMNSSWSGAKYHFLDFNLIGLLARFPPDDPQYRA